MTASSLSAAQMTAAIYRLALRAWQAPNRRAAIFRMVNETHEAFAYERALFFDFAAAAPRLAAVSGQEYAAPDTTYAAAACQIAQRLRQRAAAVFRAEDLPDLTSAWAEVCPGREVLWLPLSVDGRNMAALWLERSVARCWSTEEIALLNALAEGYAAALVRYQTFWQRLARTVWSRRIAGFLALALAIYACWPAPVRIMAPCEVVAEDPAVVTAPLNGIIAEVWVKPGDLVTEGQTLFRYDDRVARQDWEVAERQVSMARALLDEALALAMREREAQARTRLLQAQLAQEEARLELARYVCERLVVKAPGSGVVEMDDPGEWQGRPVKVGERLLRIVMPQRTRVRFWVGERDRVPEIEKNEGRVFLPSASNTVFRVRVLWVNTAVQNSPQGMSSFMGEAHWLETPPAFALGQQGQIALYGRRQPRLYALCRRPLAALRPWLGW